MGDDSEQLNGSAEPSPQTQHVCPNCGSVWTEREIARSNYQCRNCGIELAHLRTAANGTTKELVGWLLQPGDIVAARYRVDKILGKGGFAATYLVEDQRVGGKKRALKETPESFYNIRETQLLGHLNHAAIPDIIDQLNDSGMVYLVLKFGGDRTLDTERKNLGGRVPFIRALPWLLQLGEVLRYLHTQDPPIIHRDLKPSNILLDERGRIMLIDFGIAKQELEDGHTQPEGQAATHGFSPPEQTLGTGTDPRSDVYSLAATAYALMTGNVPTAAHQRVAGAKLPPPNKLSGDIPREINDIIVQALSLNVNLRPQTIEQFLRPFEQILPGYAPPEPTNTSSLTVPLGSPGMTPMDADDEGSTASVRIGNQHLTVSSIAVNQHDKQKTGIGRTLLLIVPWLLLAGGGGYWAYSELVQGGNKEVAGPIETGSGAKTPPVEAPTHTNTDPGNTMLPPASVAGPVETVSEANTPSVGAVIPTTTPRPKAVLPPVSIPPVVTATTLPPEPDNKPPPTSSDNTGQPALQDPATALRGQDDATVAKAAILPSEKTQPPPTNLPTQFGQTGEPQATRIDPNPGPQNQQGTLTQARVLPSPAKAEGPQPQTPKSAMEAFDQQRNSATSEVTGSPGHSYPPPSHRRRWNVRGKSSKRVQ